MREIEVKTYTRVDEDCVGEVLVSKEDFDIICGAYRDLQQKYFERGMAMQNSGDIVRSLFIPYIKQIKEIARTETDARTAITKIQDVLDALNKHTPLGD